MSADASSPQAAGDEALDSDEPTRLVVETLRLIAHLAADQRAASIVSIVGAVSFASTIIAAAWVIGWVTERLILPTLAKSGDEGVSLGLAAAVIAGVALWKSISIILRRGGATWWQLRAEQGLRRDMVAHQLGLSLRWYASRGVGDLLSVSGNDTKQSTGLLAPLPFAVGAVFLLIGSMTLILTIDVLLGLIAGLVMVLVVVVDSIGSHFAFQKMERVQHDLGRLSMVAHESFDGALTVRALGREQEESARFGATSESLREAIVRLGRSWTAFRAVTDIGPTLGTILILTLATARAASGRVDPGDLVTIAYLLSLLTVPTRLIGYLVWDSARSVAGWRRVRRVLDVDDRLRHGERPASGRAGGAAIRVEGVHFAYAPGQPILAGVDLTLEPGRTYAVVGPTGSGKSTVARLLARLWDPDAGRIVLDDVDVRDLLPGVVPAEVAYVPQEPFLFDDSVHGNITLGDPTIDDETVDRAVRLARLDEVVAGLPDGLATRVGERGATLSGGQQQRLGLARALARRPRLIVLDDATSAIDAELESEILAGLRDASLGATVVMVAARTSTISLADEVIHLVGGRVADRGTHSELVARSPAYASLVEAYARDAARRTATTSRGAALPVREEDPDSTGDHGATGSSREARR
jgi:ABC-type multidrug transport system fused ATPase/permease subunit